MAVIVPVSDEPDRPAWRLLVEKQVVALYVSPERSGAADRGLSHIEYSLECYVEREDVNSVGGGLPFLPPLANQLRYQLQNRPLWDGPFALAHSRSSR
jgi:hypothetical protein